MTTFRNRRAALLLLAGAAAAAAILLIGAAGSPPSHAATPAVIVFPIAGDRVAAPSTQITFRGIPASQLGAIAVTGSKSGAHAGRVEADSDGQGGSFLPAKPFTAGETVTVHTGLNIVGGSGGTYSFTIQTPANPAPVKPLRSAPRTRGDVWRFASRRDLQPAAVAVTKRPAGAESGALFVAPQAGPVQNSAEILGPYGGLIYDKPAPKGDTITDFREQTLGGQPVLTWWQGHVTMSGVGTGEDEIYDSHYRPLATVRAGNGLHSDLHEFELTPNGDALVTAYQPVFWDASKVKHGSKHEIVLDAVAQEIDIKTGLVLFQWDSLDHVAVADSVSPVARRPGVAWDYFHINSIEPESDGTFLISSRNTDAIYRVSGATGGAFWTLGGRHSTFKMAAGTRFAYQHDARMRSATTLSLFDDGGSPFVEKQSRDLTIGLDPAKRTATIVSQKFHSPALRAAAEGNVQRLANNDDFVGWGAANNFTEFNSRGRAVFDARFVGPNASYRAYRFAWSGSPVTLPAIAARWRGANTTVDASWNGATALNRWRVLAGSSPASLKPAGGGAKKAFETAFTITGHPRYVEVQALDRHGKPLAASRTIRG